MILAYAKDGEKLSGIEILVSLFVCLFVCWLVGGLVGLYCFVLFVLFCFALFV